MAGDAVQLDLDTRDLERFGRQLERELASSGGGPMRSALTQVSAVYMGFTRDRFDRFSKGGGDWPPLSESTLRRRRKARRGRRANQTAAIQRRRGGTGQAAILRDTGQLLNSISQFESEDIPGGVRVGTNVQYASYHQHGGVNLPQREIFVQPDPPTLGQMTQLLEQGLQKSIDAMGGGR